MDVIRIETTRGMISDLMARGEPIQETALGKDAHGRGQMPRISTDLSFRDGQPNWAQIESNLPNPPAQHTCAATPHHLELTPL
jgi:hypothetical protein